MDSSLVIPLITGSGAAGIFCVLFITGRVFPKSVVDDLKAEIAELKAQNIADRAKGDAAVAAASTTADILSAIKLGRELGSAQEGP